MSNQDVKTKIKPNLKFSEPSMFKIIYMNDDVTTMEFVVDVLVSIFNKTPSEAELIMREVHMSGNCVVGTYTYDIAISRTNLTIQVARKNGFPLRVEVE